MPRTHPHSLAPIDVFDRVSVLLGRAGRRLDGASYAKVKALISAGERDPGRVLADVLAAHNATFGLPAPAPLAA